MPIYEYECLECGLHFDRLQRFGEPQPSTCPNGHGRVHRRLSQPTIIFKGSGFYVTDNGRNGSGTVSRTKTKRSEPEATPSATPAQKNDQKPT